MPEYQMALSREIDARLKTKCDKVADAFVMDDIGTSMAPYHFCTILQACIINESVMFFFFFFFWAF